MRYRPACAAAALFLAAAARAAAGALTLAAVPWSGPDLPGSIAATVKYRVTVWAPAGTHVTLTAGPVPAGWVAAWCTDRVCTPKRAAVVVGPGGTKAVEFQVVPDEPAHAARHPRVRLQAQASGATATTTVAG